MKDIPGLAIIRDPGRRESYSVVHEPSGAVLVPGCAGPGTAEGMALDLAGLTDWTLPASRLLAALEADRVILAEIDRAALRWGFTTNTQAVT